METKELLLQKYGAFTEKPPKFIPGGRRSSGLAGLFKELGFTNGAEIGTEYGTYAKCLCDTMPGLKLLCVDAWMSYGDYRWNYSQESQEEIYNKCKEILAPYNVDIRRGFSMDVVKTIPDESLDFVFIDGNHDFQNATNDIAEWSKKVKKGGIVSGHDYMRLRVKGEKLQVKDVLDGWTYANGIKVWWVFTGDRGPSWFYVKE